MHTQQTAAGGAAWCRSCRVNVWSPAQMIVMDMRYVVPASRIRCVCPEIQWIGEQAGVEM